MPSQTEPLDTTALTSDIQLELAELSALVTTERRGDS
jgi:hypothetical protein